MSKRQLHIVDGAYRATLEEQDDPVVWLCHAMRGAGAELPDEPAADEQPVADGLRVGRSLAQRRKVETGGPGDHVAVAG